MGIGYKDIKNLTKEEAYEKFPMLDKKYDKNTDALFDKYIKQKQERNKDKDIDIIGEFYKFDRNNHIFSLHKYKEKYGDLLPKDDLDNVNLMYRTLFDKQKIIHKANAVKNRDVLWDDKMAKPLSMDLAEFANNVHPLLEDETNIKLSPAFDILKYTNNITDRKIVERYKTEDIANFFGIDFGIDQVINNTAAYRASYATAAKDKLKISQLALNEYFGEEIPITYDDRTGSYVYKHPRTNKLTLLDNPDDFGEEFRSVIGGSIPILGDLAGMVMVGGVGGKLASMAVKGAVKTLSKAKVVDVGGDVLAGTSKVIMMGSGAGFGYAMGESFRDWMALSYLNPDLDTGSDEFKKLVFDRIEPRFAVQFDEYGIPFDMQSAIITSVLDTVFRSIRYSKAVLKGNKLTRKQFKDVTSEVDLSLKLQDDLNKIVKEVEKKYGKEALPDANKLKFTLAEASRSRELLARQQVYENSIGMGKTKKYIEWGLNEAKALNKIYESKIKGINGKTIDDALIDDLDGRWAESMLGERLLKLVDEWKAPQQQKILKETEDAAEGIVKNFNSPVRVTSEGTRATVGGQRSIVKTIYDDWYTSTNKMFEAIEPLATKTKIGTIPATNFIKVIKASRKRIEGGFSPTGKIKDLVGERALALLNRGSRAEMSFRELVETRSDLMLKKRLGKDADMAGTPLDDLISALNDDIRLFSYRGQKKWKAGGNSGLSPEKIVYDQWDEATAKYKKELVNYSGVIRKLAKTDPAGKFTLADENVFRNTFLPNTKTDAIETATDLATFFKHGSTVDLRNGYLNEFSNFFKSKVLKEKEILVNGTKKSIDVLDKKAYKKFMSEYGDTLKAIFPEEYKKIVAKQGDIKTLDNILFESQSKINKINTAGVGKLSKLDPDEIVGKLWNSEKPLQFKRFLDVVKKESPELFGETQQAILRRLKRSTSIRTPDGHLIFSAAEFQKQLVKNDGLFKLMFQNNPEHLSFLKKFSKAVDISQGSPSKNILSMGKGGDDALQAFGPPMEAVGMLRSLYFRPLSAKGVAFTNFLSGYGKLIDDKMGDILINPDKTMAMNDLAKLFRGGNYEKSKDVLHEILGIPAKFEAYKGIPDFFKDGLDTDYTGKVQETFWGFIPKKLEERGTYDNLTPIDKKNLLDEIKKPTGNTSSKLSQSPVNVANYTDLGFTRGNRVSDTINSPVNQKEQSGGGITSLNNKNTQEKLSSVGMDIFARS